MSLLKDINEPAQDVYEAAHTRRSIRAYKPDTVPLETIREIPSLGATRRAGPTCSHGVSMFSLEQP